MKTRIYYLSRLRPSVSARAEWKGKEERIRNGIAEWILFRHYWQENDSPAALARRLDITGDELALFLKERFEEKYMAMRKRLRIEDAGEIMLEHPEVPIYLIGKIVGISDKSDFRKLFATEKGCTPSVWKKCKGRSGRIWLSALQDKAQNHFRSLHKS